MFCPRCGKQAADDVRFCAGCGFDFGADTPAAPAQPATEQFVPLAPPIQPAAQPQYQMPQQPVQPQYQAPQQPAYQQPQTYQQNIQQAPAKSGSFYDKVSPKLLVLLSMVLALIFQVCSGFATLNADLTEMSFVSVVEDLEVIDADLDSALREAEWELDNLRWEFEQKKANLSRTERNVIEASLDASEAFVEDPTLINLHAFAEAVEEEVELVGIEESTEIAGLELPDDPVDVVELLILIVLGVFYLLPLLFTLLGGLLRSKALVITAIVFTALSHIVLGSYLWLFLLVAVYVVQMVFITKAKQMKKAI